MGFFDKLKTGLNKTKESINEKINDVFSNFRKVDENFLEELEEILIMSDIGIDTSTKIIDRKEVNALSKRKKKRGNKAEPDSYLNLVTAILNLVIAILLLIEKLTE